MTLHIAHKASTTPLHSDIENTTATINRGHNKLVIIAITAILTFGFWLRAPLIGQGMPFFLHEDEAHHFNRVVRMMQSGDLNPHYFHKPSLHFYLRLPVTGAAFLSEVSKGHLRSVHDIKTKDQSGIADYAFVASHPAIVKWNRALSVLLSLGCIYLVSRIARLCVTTPSSQLMAVVVSSLFCAISPTFIAESAVIGVDVPMTFFCLATAFTSIIFLSNPSRSSIALSGLLAGLACSSKYNALPIVATPMLAVLFSKTLNKGTSFATALTASIIGFFMGSPYIIASIPQFLDQFAYEIWHYGIAGHEGHMAEPGFAQMWHYTKWLCNEGIGLVGLASAMTSIALCARINLPLCVVIFSFPVLFFALMVGQKANFTRNMIVVIPFFSIGCGVLSGFCVDRYKLNLKKIGTKWIAAALACGLMIQPLYIALAQRWHDSSRQTDSRLQATEWLHANQGSSGTIDQVALDGSLWMPPFVTYVDGLAQGSLAGITRIHGELPSVAQLFNQGFDRLVTHTRVAQSLPNGLTTKSVEFSGTLEPQRVVNNPAISVVQLSHNTLSQELLSSSDLPSYEFVSLKENNIASPKPSTNSESHTWIQHRLTRLKLPEGTTHLRFQAMSPWDGQVIVVRNESMLIQLEPTPPGIWRNYSVALPAGVNKNSFVLSVSKIKSPQAEGLSSDTRRLGLAIRPGQ